MSRDSILAGTEVQDLLDKLRKPAEQYESQIAEIVGVEATGQGWDAPGFEEVKGQIMKFRELQAVIAEFCVNRVIAKYEEQGLA